MTTDTSPDPAPETIQRDLPLNGLTLRYLDRGPADARPVILLHGIRDQARNWDAVATRLATRHRVIALDLRGHGDSDWSPDGAYLLAYHVGDLKVLVDALGWDRVSLVGHSYGGSLASRYAGLYPDRIARLAVVDGFGPASANYEQWAQDGVLQRTRDWIAQREAFLAKPPRQLASIAEGAARLAQGNPRLSPAQLEHFATHALRADGDGFVWKFDPRVSIFAPEDFAFRITEFWRAVTAPTLLCYGAESWSALEPGDDRLGVLADVRIESIANAGHWPHHDQVEAFTALLADFLG